MKKKLELQKLVPLRNLQKNAYYQRKKFYKQ